MKVKSGSIVIQKRSFYFNAQERIFISIVTRNISGLLAYITTLVFLMESILQNESAFEHA